MLKENLLATFDYFRHFSPRSPINKPVKQGGYCYASNSHVLITMPYSEGLEFEETESPAYIKVIPTSEYWHTPIKVNIGRFSDITEKLSDESHQFEEIACEACTGGKFDHYGIEYDCSSCHGNGFNYGKVLKVGKSTMDLIWIKTPYGHSCFTAYVLHHIVYAAQKSGITEWQLVASEDNRPWLFISGEIKVILLPYEYNIEDEFGEIKVAEIVLD